jgi:hypothetical protein
MNECHVIGGDCSKRQAHVSLIPWFKIQVIIPTGGQGKF